MILIGVSISLRIPVESSPLDSFWAPKLIVIVLKIDIYIVIYSWESLTFSLAWVMGKWPIK